MNLNLYTLYKRYRSEHDGLSPASAIRWARTALEEADQAQITWEQQRYEDGTTAEFMRDGLLVKVRVTLDDYQDTDDVGQFACDWPGPDIPCVSKSAKNYEIARNCGGEPRWLILPDYLEPDGVYEYARKRGMSKSNAQREVFRAIQAEATRCEEFYAGDRAMYFVHLGVFLPGSDEELAFDSIGGVELGYGDEVDSYTIDDLYHEATYGLDEVIQERADALVELVSRLRALRAARRRKERTAPRRRRIILED